MKRGLSLSWRWQAVLLTVTGCVSVVTFSQSVNHVGATNNNPYHHVISLDSDPGRYILEWTVNWTARQVVFQVIVQSTGFAIFGLSRGGALAGADVVVGGVDSTTGVPYLRDMHGSLGDHPRIQEDRSQDYVVVSAAENGTHTRIKFSRDFDTCDGDQDYRINDDTVEVLWGFGENDNYDVAHRHIYGTYKTYLLDPDWTPRGIQEARRTGAPLTSRELGDLTIWTVSRKERVPARDTVYWCSIHQGPVLSKRHHLVGFEFRVDNPLQLKHTHHLQLHRCTPPAGVDPQEFFEPFVQNDTGESCFLMSRDPSQSGAGLPLAHCGDTVYVYAIGGRQFFLPEEAGIAIGDSPNEYFLMQVHYDNPEVSDNLEYEVNIDLYYTPNLRHQLAGIMTVGHQLPGSPSILVPPDSSRHNIYGHCGGSCTSQMLPPEGINIFGVLQHTHNSGVGFRFQHFRGDRELPWIFNDNNYDNQFQPTRMTRNDVRVLPGDQLSTRCVYDNTWTNGSSVTGGLSTRQEMCLVYIWYTSKVDYRQCRSEIADVRYSQKHLGVSNWTWHEPDLEYVATDGSALEGLTVTQVSNMQNWSRWRRQEIARDQLLMPHETNCVSNADLTSGGRGAAQRPIARYPVGITEYVPVEEGPNCRRAV